MRFSELRIIMKKAGSKIPHVWKTTESSADPEQQGPESMLIDCSNSTPSGSAVYAIYAADLPIVPLRHSMMGDPA